tara:strand:+ start:317 stop:472 length:156 start_codon:yes stop_codon:yes gene_type:complete
MSLIYVLNKEIVHAADCATFPYIIVMKESMLGPWLETSESQLDAEGCPDEE